MAKIIKDERKRKMVLARLMCFIMLVFISALIMYIYAVDSVKHTEQASITGYKEDAFDKIYAQLEFLRKQSYECARVTATNIENELKNKDLAQMKLDMDAGQFNSELYNVIKNNISGKSLNGIDNRRNGLIVMTQTGVFEDFNYERAASDDIIRTWESEVDNSYNPELEQDAINKILNHSNSIIVTERFNHIKSEDGKDDHIKIHEATYESLKKVYMKEGIEGFRNYQFKTPAYITDTGDIFGQEDIVQGVKKYNHKIIVVQEFNLYSQLQAFDDESFKADDEILYIKEKFSATTVTLYILGFFYIASIIALLFYFSNMYNYYIDANNLDQYDNRNKGDTKVNKEEKTQT